MTIENSTAPGAPSLDLLLEKAPRDVCSLVSTFLLGVKLTVGEDDAALGRWRSRLANELARIDLRADDAVANVTSAVENVEKEFTALEVSRRKHRQLLISWLVALGLCALVDQLLGEGGFLARSAPEGRMCKVFSVTSIVISHSVTHYTDCSSATRFDFPTTTQFSVSRQQLASFRGLRQTSSSGGAIAYVISWLIAGKKLDLTLFGFAFAQGKVEAFSNPDSCGCTAGPGFVDAAALFTIGICAGIATDILLQRLVKAARTSASQIFAE